MGKRGRPKKIKPVDNSGAEEVKDTVTVSAAVVIPEPIKVDKPEEIKPEVKINLPNPIIYKFICGVCHNANVLKPAETGLESGNGKVIKTGRTIKMYGDIVLMEFVCLGCGCSTFKINPEVETGELRKKYPNLLLKRG